MEAILVALVLLASPPEGDVWTHFKTTPQGIESCKALNEKAQIAHDVCARLVYRESYGGMNGAMRLCKEWIHNDKGWSCSGYISSEDGWSSFSREYISQHASEVSEWQLRNSPTWSWIRFHNEATGDKLSVMDMKNPDNALKVMVSAYNHLKNQADKLGAKCTAKDENGKCKRRCKVLPGTEDMLWLQYWNGCSSYSSHAKAVLGFRKTQVD